MNKIVVGLIVGTGMGEVLSGVALATHRGCVLETPFGGPVHYLVVDTEKVSLVIIDRHNSSEVFVPPKRLNWQSYMYVLWKLKVQYILATSAVGTPYKEKGGLRQGSMVVIADAIDYVHGDYSFEREGFTDHLAFYRPTESIFCPHLRQALEGGEYPSMSRFVLANSIRRPAYETLAEMNIRIRDGADVVGMPTAFPEALLAGELSIPYGLLCGVSNIAPAQHNGQAVGEVMRKMVPQMRDSVLRAVTWLARNEHPADCSCRQGREKSVFEMLGIPSF